MLTPVDTFNSRSMGMCHVQQVKPDENVGEFQRGKFQDNIKLGVREMSLSDLSWFRSEQQIYISVHIISNLYNQ